MVSPDIYTAVDDKLNVGRDNLYTAGLALAYGREACLGKYSSYAYTNALASEIILCDGNPFKAVKNLHEKGFANFRNPVEAGVAVAQHLKKQAIENANNQRGGNKKPENPPNLSIPREHGRFFGKQDKAEQAITDWDNPTKFPTVRLIYDAKQELNPGPLKLADMVSKLSQHPRVNIDVVAVHTPEELIAALDEAQLHKEKGPVFNLVCIHGDLRVPEPGQPGVEQQPGAKQPGADLFVGGWEEENKVNTRQVVASTEGTITCFISCYGGLVFDSVQNEKTKTPAGKEATGVLADPKPTSALNPKRPNVLPQSCALSDQFGFSGKFMEARIFADAAVCRIKGIPVTRPQTIGCRPPTVLGIIRYLQQSEQPKVKDWLKKYKSVNSTLDNLKIFDGR